MEATIIHLSNNPNRGAVIPFLDLPERYNLWVYDLMHFNFSSPPNSDYPLKDVTTAAGTLLVSKMIDALRNWKSHHEHATGYTDEEISKVGGLVERHMHTVHSAQVRGEVEKVTTGVDGAHVDVPRLTVDLVLRGFFDKSFTRDASVNINSNEPVLLVNFEGDESGRMDPAQLDLCNYVVDILTTELRHKWNICPVRVYAGAFLPRNPQSVGDDHGGQDGNLAFSVTLLNVVNTDIGGPSMPQLLDEPCEAPIWNRMLRKEVWRGWDLVSREDLEHGDDRQAHIALDIDNASERSYGSGDDDHASIGSDALGLSASPEQPQERAGSTRQEPELEEHVATPSADSQQQKAPITHDIREREQARAIQPQDLSEEETNIEEHREHDLPETGVEGIVPQTTQDIGHPTWYRPGDSASLLDLIRSQVSTIAPFGTGTAGQGAADVEGVVAESTEPKAESASSSEKVEPAPAGEKSSQAKSSSEDEFVVI